MSLTSLTLIYLISIGEYSILSREQDCFKQANLEIYEVKDRANLLPNPFVLNLRKVHFHKLVKSPQYKIAGLKGHSYVKIPHQLHFSALQNPSDPPDMSGSNKLDAIIGNSCANCIVLHSCAKANDLHVVLPSLAKHTKGEDQIKGRYKLIVVAAIFEVDCCVDVGAGTRAIHPGGHILWEDAVQPAGRIQDLLTLHSNDRTSVTNQCYNSPF